MNFVALPRFGSGIGLERVQFLLDALEIDRTWLSRTAVNVTGTNGKGSTAQMCSRIGTGHSLRTGLFTSPHMFRFTERFQIDGVEVAMEQFEASCARVGEHVDLYLTEHPEAQFAGFEVLFAAAADLFFRAGCEFCVYEAGIGGRYDPVRLTKARTAAVTSLDYDHTRLLGDTLELICLDKTDICANGGSIFYGTNCEPYRRSVETYCGLRELSSTFLGRDQELEIAAVSAEGTEFQLRLPGRGKERYFTPLIGEHQANNAALALLLFENWCNQSGSCVFDRGRARDGLSQTRWPGRLEVVSSAPLIVIDSASSPDGIRAALQGLRLAFQKSEFLLVTGVSNDKDARSILSLLSPEFTQILCTQAHKGRDPEVIAELAGQLNAEAVIGTAASIAEAVSAARGMAIEKGWGVYVAGGGYLAAEFAHCLQGGEPSSISYLS